MAVPNLTPEQLQQILALRNGQGMPSGPGRVWYDPRFTTDDPNGWMVHEYLGQRLADNQGDTGNMVADPSLDARFISRLRPDTGGKLADKWDLQGNYLGTFDAQDGGGRQFNTAALMFGGALGGNLAMANTAQGATAATTAAGAVPSASAAPGAAVAGSTAAGAAAPAAGSAGAATGLAGAAKTALPWVSAATQLYGTYAQGKAAQDAAAAQQAAAQQGIGEQRRQFDLVQSLLAPYAQAGTKAIGAQGDLAGLNGADAQRAAIAALESSPQMAALTKQGETAILQNASATGGLRGGNVQGALATFRPQMLSALIDQQYGRLGWLTSIGQNAAAGTGNAGMLTGNAISNLLTQQGAAQAGGALAQGATNTGYAAALAQLAGMYGGLGGATPGGTPPIAPTTRGGF